MTELKKNDRTKKFLELVLPLDLTVRKLLIPILFLIGWASVFYGVPYPLFPLGVILAIYFMISGSCFWLISHDRLPSEIAYCVLLASDCFLVALATYYTGGIESFVPLIYGIIGLLAGLTLPFWGVIVVAITAASTYIIELGIEANNFLPHIEIFKGFMPQGSFALYSYLIIIPLAHLVIFIAATSITYMVAEILRSRQDRLAALNLELQQNSELLVSREDELNSTNERLDEKLHELEELKTTLEEKVRERTSELETAKEGLEIEVARRTEELAKDKDGLELNIKERTKQLQEKVNELQVFYDTTIGRELKMMELEKEVNDLLTQLGRLPKYR
jgi:Skp family chaperone for outer membrane proteins